MSGWKHFERDGNDVLWQCDECAVTVWCSREPSPFGHSPECSRYVAPEDERAAAAESELDKRREDSMPGKGR